MDFLGELSLLRQKYRQEAENPSTLANIAALDKTEAIFRQDHNWNRAVLKGLTQIEALVEHARVNNGLLRLPYARRDMIDAGLIRTPKNAPGIISILISRSDRFERLKRGVYRLKDPG